MQIQNIKPYNINFMAHYYKIEPKSQFISVISDNPLGKEPKVFYKSPYHKFGMCTNGGWYIDENNTIEVEFPMEFPYMNYHIYYIDTKLFDNDDGYAYRINTDRLLNKAQVALREQANQKLIEATNPGKTVGKLMFFDKLGSNIDKIDEPFIVVTPYLSRNQIRNPNLRGIIFTRDSFVSTSHEASQLRQITDIYGSVYDPKVIERLKKFEGKNIEIELKDDYIRFNETDKKGKPKIYPKINVPRLKYCDRILTSDEFTNDVIGAKAVNLRRLEELKESGIIDVKIPKSIGLPYGYIEKLMNVDSDEEKNVMLKELIKTMRENGIVTEDVIVRSAFNSEDLPNYSAAGLYSSERSPWKHFGDKYLLESINNVYNSKNNSTAKISRSRYQIDDDNVKPGEIIQDFIVPNYSFTIYTDTNDGKLKIEMFSGNNAFGTAKNGCTPHIFTYDRITGSLTYDAIQTDDCSSVIFNENEEIVEIPPLKHDLSGNKKLFKQLKKLYKMH